MEKVIDIGFAKLCVDVDYKGVRPEVYILLESNDGTETCQDICMVSQAIQPHTEEIIPNTVRCLVWNDSHKEDYTQEFIIEDNTRMRNTTVTAGDLRK